MCWEEQIIWLYGHHVHVSGVAQEDVCLAAGYVIVGPCSLVVLRTLYASQMIAGSIGGNGKAVGQNWKAKAIIECSSVIIMSHNTKRPVIPVNTECH